MLRPILLTYIFIACVFRRLAALPASTFSASSMSPLPLLSATVCMRSLMYPAICFFIPPYATYSFPCVLSCYVYLTFIISVHHDP